MVGSGLDLKMLRQLRNTFSSSLSDFTSSSSTFRILRSVPTSSSPRTDPVRILYVLDSSFNPPSKAHAYLASSTISSNLDPSSCRLLLLLATSNADKAQKPAEFADRLVMMTLFAQEVRDQLGPGAPAVDLGVTKLPFFSDKAASINESGDYQGNPTQVHVTGFDTIIRIFDKKYYRDQGFKVLKPFFETCKLRVTFRPGDKWGDKEEQRAYVDRIRNGERKDEGIEEEWANRIEMVEGMPGEVVSSTEARMAGEKHDGKGLERYVGDQVKSWIMEEQLYEKEKPLKNGPA